MPATRSYVGRVFLLPDTELVMPKNGPKPAWQVAVRGPEDKDGH